MAGRNTRVKRNSKQSEYDWKKILIAVFILILLIVGIIFFIKFIKNKTTDKQIAYWNKKHEYFVLCNDEKFGVIGSKGQEIIKPEYTEIYIPNEEKDVFFCYDEQNNLTILNKKAEKILTEYENVSLIRTSDTLNIDFEENVLKYEKDGKFGLIDLEGTKITDPIYQTLSSVENKPGAILAKKDDKVGVLNCNGNIIIEFKYDGIVGDGYSSEKDFYQKTGYITKEKTNSGDNFGYINYKGKKLLETKYESIERVLEYDEENIYLICMNNGKKGVIKNGKQIISFNYQNIYYSNTSNIFTVQKNNKTGFKNNQGKTILPEKYDEYSIAGNYICVNEDNGKKLYDVNGNSLKNINYISMIETKNPEYFIAENEEGNYCIISKNVIVDENFVYLSYAFDNYFIFMNQYGKYGVIDVWNGVVIEPNYDQIIKIDGADALEAKKFENAQTDIYSKEIEIISTISEAIVEKVDENYTAIYSNGERFYIDNKGQVVSNTVVYPENTIYSFKENGKWGYKNKEGQVIIEPKYDFVTELNEYGFASIAINGVWGVINSEGKIIVEPSYSLEVYYMPKFVGEYFLQENEYCEKIN